MNDNEKIKEPIWWKIKRNIFTKKLITVLLIISLILIFVIINLLIQKIDLAQIDVTENKVYTLSDTSKNQIKNIDKDVKIYLYGYTDNSSVADLVKQYCKTNNKISYEILSEETNKAKFEEFKLQSGFNIAVVEVGSNYTIIDGDNEFHSYDFLTGQETDLTEQKLTNTIINLTEDKKAKVYFLEGHEEYNDQKIGTILTYLDNENYDYDKINLLLKSEIPEDCDVLFIASPTKDLLEKEANAIIDYINNGGNIIFSKDTEESQKDYPYFQKILDIYGIKVINGCVYETDFNHTIPNYQTILRPVLNEFNNITSQINSDSFILIPSAQKIETLSEEDAQNNSISYQTLISSTDNAYYITDFSDNMEQMANSATKGETNIAVLATKKIIEGEEQVQEKQSEIIVIGNGIFFSDTIIPQIDKEAPISYVGNNKDFILNSIASLAEKEDKIVVRKEMNSSTYAPTLKQDIIVRLIIFGVPILIILVGIIIWNRRNKKR